MRQVPHMPLAPKLIAPAMCPHCQEPMWIITRIERLDLGSYMRTFECSDCEREQMVVFRQA